jgi:hypothetical protein
MCFIDHMLGSMLLHHNLSMTPLSALIGECGGWLPLPGWGRVIMHITITNICHIHNVWCAMLYDHAIGIYEHPMA